MMHYTKASETHKIEASLFGCCCDCSTCCYTIFCYPCAASHAWADSRDERCSCGHCCIYPSGLWTRMKNNYFCDCITDVCCPFCFLNQNIREIKSIQEQSRDK